MPCEEGWKLGIDVFGDGDVSGSWTCGGQTTACANIDECHDNSAAYTVAPSVGTCTLTSQVGDPWGGCFAAAQGGQILTPIIENFVAYCEADFCPDVPPGLEHPPDIETTSSVTGVQVYMADGAWATKCVDGKCWNVEMTCDPMGHVCWV